MYVIETKGEKYVSDYTGLNMYEVQELDLVEYLFLLREAYIYINMQTEEGREYLKKCRLMEQTSPDREGLRKKLKKKGGN